MENTTQFRLDQEIAAWRSGLAGSGNLSHDDLEELESHMLDEIEQLTQYPLSEREAFMVAKDRIGSFKDLNQSYAKSKSFWSLLKSRSKLYLQAVLVLIIISLTNRIVEFGTIMIVGTFELPMVWGSYLYCGFLMILFTALFLWIRLASSKSRQNRGRISFTGHLTIIAFVITLLTAVFGTQFISGPIQLELLSIFVIRQYIWIVGMIAILIASVIYSIKDFKALRIKATTH